MFKIQKFTASVGVVSWLRLFRCMLLTSMALLLVACARHHNTAPPPSEGQATLGTDGGTVTGPDGVILSIPADAVASDTTFRIARDDTGAPNLVGITKVSPTYAITPHGATFDSSALLKLPYDPSLIPSGSTAVVLRGETDGSWHVSPLHDDGNGYALINVSSLSWWTVGYCTPGDAGVFGFGIGDCPGNTNLTLEYLDGSGVAVKVPLSQGTYAYSLPIPPDITTPTTLTFRLSYTRPAGTDRTDTLSMSLNGFQSVPIDGQSGPSVNQNNFVSFVNYYVDPVQVAGAASTYGQKLRFAAQANYCWTGFIIGFGPNKTVCWEFDTDDIAFVVRDTTSHPDAPVLLQAPQNLDVVEGEDAIFSAVFDVPTTFSKAVWQRWNGTTWVTATSFSSPATTQTNAYYGSVASQRISTLTLHNTHVATDDGIRLRLQYCSSKKSGNTNCLLSGEVTLGVLPARVAPTFQLQPVDGTVVAGQTFSVTVAATGHPGPSINILRDGVVVDTCAAPGGGVFAASCTYTTPAVTVSDSGAQFWAVASNDSGHLYDATSNQATLTVTTSAVAPDITQGPVDATVTVGNSAVFTVTANGTAPLSYQWLFNGAALSDSAAGTGTSGIAGSHSSQLTISNAQNSDAGLYSVSVTNGVQPDASADAMLTVNPCTPSCVTTLASGLGLVEGVAVDGSGTVYTFDYTTYRLLAISPAGTSTVLAGSGSSGSADGTGAAASFGTAGALAVDANGNIYVTQFNTGIRKVTPAGVVTTLFPDQKADAGLAVSSDGSTQYFPIYGRAITKLVNGTLVGWGVGSTSYYGYADGVGSAAQFSYPLGMAWDTDGTLLVADSGNCALRKINVGTSTVTTVSVSRTVCARSVAVLGANSYVLADLNHVYRVDNGVATMIAGGGTQQTGRGLDVDFSAGIYGMAWDGSKLYVASGDRIAVITP